MLLAKTAKTPFKNFFANKFLELSFRATISLENNSYDAIFFQNQSAPLIGYHIHDHLVPGCATGGVAHSPENHNISLTVNSPTM